MELTHNKLMEIFHITEEKDKHCVYATTKYSIFQLKVTIQYIQ